MQQIQNKWWNPTWKCLPYIDRLVREGKRWQYMDTLYLHTVNSSAQTQRFHCKLINLFFDDKVQTLLKTSQAHGLKLRQEPQNNKWPTR